MLSLIFRNPAVLLATLMIPAATATQITAATTNAAASPAPPRQEIITLHDVIIGKGGDRDLHAEVAYPQGATNQIPAILFIHGGGWVAGSYKDAPILPLAGAGYFAASIEYRLDSEAKWPAQIEDCKLGVRWLRANAAKYHVDPNRIGVWGESAGGHLVLCLGTMADVREYEGVGGYPGVSSAVQAVVDFYGPSDFTRIWPSTYKGEGVSLVEGLFGVTHEKDPQLWKKGSPLTHVKAGDPPMLMVHGDSDRLVSINQSLLMDAALSKAGVSHQLIIVKNAGHGFLPMPGTTIDPNQSQIMEDVRSFFAKWL